MFLQIPDSFRLKIPRVFGEEGRTWLKQLPDIIQQCVQKWNLEQLMIVPNLSYNFVCYAESPTLGEVVLKIGVPNEEWKAEMKSLTCGSGRPLCTCHDADPELGALLLEKIIPGFTLTVIRNRTTRYKVAADLMKRMPIATESEADVPYYADWLERAFVRAEAKGGADEEWSGFINTARAWFEELKESDQPTLLLHGDLHHENMLFDESRGWMGIDPKGVFGLRSFEAARFMQNELDKVPNSDRSDCLQQMVSVFSTALDIPESVTARSLFVDYVLSACWYAEEEADDRQMENLIDHIRLVHDFAKDDPQTRTA